MSIRLIAGLLVLVLAAPAFAQDDAAQRQRDADRAIQDSLRNIDRAELQQRQNALEQRVQNLEQQRREEADLRALQAQTPPPPALVQTLPNPQSAYSSSPARISPFAAIQPDVGTAPEGLRRRAADGYAACLVAAASRLDDRISDAATVALAIEPACTKEFDAWRAALEEGAVRDARLALERALNASRQSAAIQAVLQSRQNPAPPRRN